MVLQSRGSLEPLLTASVDPVLVLPDVPEQYSLPPQ